ncbi:MAG: twin-arginine translocation signal domain-containing protein, partial [Proteiniphilum sp.]
MDRRNFLRAVALTGAALTTVKETEAMSILTQSFASAQATAYD